MKKTFEVDRVYTKNLKDGYGHTEFKERVVALSDGSGKEIFREKVTAPMTWSDTAVTIVAEKYFSGQQGQFGRETSVKQLIDRVVFSCTQFAIKEHKLDRTNAKNFAAELTYMLVNQIVSFNSPVWFNLGAKENPQCSACFINSVDDSMESILDLAKTEGMLFKYGSGSGANLSRLRAKGEKLAGGGSGSGPVSFMRGLDAFAGAIKSGGGTRRAAKMVLLDVDHPDILEFIECKSKEEKKAHALIDAGYDGGFNVDGGAYSTVAFQNGNNSVRVTDEFMDAVELDGDWELKDRVGKGLKKVKARELWRAAAQAAWECGDPGIQFDTTINKMHTSPNSGRINASNPCSEYIYIDDSACNLASFNLMKLSPDLVEHATRIMILAMDSIVSGSSYPTEKIRQNSLKFRPLGLGYANLGALIMTSGYAYDSDEGREICTKWTKAIHHASIRASIELAEINGPCEGWVNNREAQRRVAALQELPAKDLDRLAQFGIRNMQTTVLAPTGTIGFMMDCATTGIEPDIALIKYKKLVGGGYLKLVNPLVMRALDNLGYAELEMKSILKYIETEETVEGSILNPKHLAVFDCAFKAQKGTRSISPMGHLRMMAAAQPYLSGAISKTVNMPKAATVDDIADAYMEAWRMGIKAVAVYRDNCKRSQPLSTSKKEEKECTKEEREADDKKHNDPPKKVQAMATSPHRRRLPDTRQSITHKFSIGGQEGYATVGLFVDGSPGELFVTMSKQGSTISGFVDAWATSISLLLQNGVDVSALAEKFSNTRFDPSGWTTSTEIRSCTSVVDYLIRWLAGIAGAIEPQKAEEDNVKKIKNHPTSATVSPPTKKPGEGPPCGACGTATVRAGSCWACPACGTTTGCG